jgi:8-amino-7-oxononanoate synthase
VTGTTELHAELERELADFCGAEAAVVFASGYAANLAAVTALGDAETLIVSDALNHASLIDGCRLARGRVARVPHADPEAVAEALASRAEPYALVVTDGVFSVDGDAAPLSALSAACRAHGAALLVDDAHGLGVLGPGGRGALAAAGLAGEPDTVATVTLSKSLGAQGGAVVGPARVVRHLTQAARTFIFDTGLAPASAAAALRALQILGGEPDLAGRVRAHAATIARELLVSSPDAAIVPVVLGDPARAVAAAEHCRARGVLVGCFRPPSVPPGTSRLRLTARADLTEGELAKALAIVRSAIEYGAIG